MTNNTLWMHDRILLTQPKKLRMPYLCALSKSLAAPIFSEGWNEMTRGLNTHYHQLKENESYITSMAVNGNTTIALASGHPDGTITFIREDVNDKEEIPPSRFHEIYQTQLHCPIYSLDWCRQHLLAGSNQAVTQLYDTHLLDSEGPDVQKLGLIGEYRSNHKPALYSAPPGKCALNSHVKSVSFSPSYTDQQTTTDSNTNSATQHFTSTITSHIELWDVNYEGHNSLRTFEPDQGAINVSHWSTLSPSLVVAGGQEGLLNVIDLRLQEHQGIVWQGTHGGSVLDAQFSPFIPFWLASAGDDGVVDIWDLRATCHKPLAKIDGHLGPVTSVAWANLRPEKLATTSRDGSFRMWSLLESTIPIWETCYRKANPLLHSDDVGAGTGEWLREGPQLVEEEKLWWPGSVVSETKAIDDDFGIVTDDVLLETNQVELVGAFGIGEWGKMNIGPLYYGDAHRQSKGSVVKTLVSQCRPGQFYSVTSFGQLCSQIFRPTSCGLLDYPHRFDYNKDPLYYTIDNAIYYRHIKVAENLIEKLKALPIDDEEKKRQGTNENEDSSANFTLLCIHRLRDDQVMDFEDCLQLRPSIKPSEWEIDSIPERESKRLWTETDRWQCALNTFRKDLAYWRCRIAPGCESAFNEIPLDTGDRHPRLSSELMQNAVPNGTLRMGLPSPSPPPPPLSPSLTSLEPMSQTSHLGLDKNPGPPSTQRLRRSSTTPNLTSEDLLTPYEDLKSMNERNSSGTLLNTGITWKPLQRAKTALAPSQRGKRLSPSLSVSSSLKAKLQKVQQPSSSNDDITHGDSDVNEKQLDTPETEISRPASPKEMDLKAIIKNGSFKKPLSPAQGDDIDNQRQEGVDASPKPSSAMDNEEYATDQHLHQSSNPAQPDMLASPQEMDLKSIIKYGSFKQPPAQTHIDDSLHTPSTTADHHHQADSTLTLSPTTTREEPRPALRRQPSSILSPAKSLSRAFTKKLRRKKTSMSSLSPSEREPEQHRQQLQAEASRPNPRNTL